MLEENAIWNRTFQQLEQGVAAGLASHVKLMSPQFWRMTAEACTEMTTCGEDVLGKDGNSIGGSMVFLQQIGPQSEGQIEAEMKRALC